MNAIDKYEEIEHSDNLGVNLNKACLVDKGRELHDDKSRVECVKMVASSPLLSKHVASHVLSKLDPKKKRITAWYGKYITISFDQKNSK